MLILTRKRGESIYIGGRIKITVVELKGNQVRVGIDAPQEEKVYREEIYLQILEENRQAAQAAATEDEAGMESLSELWEKRDRTPVQSFRPRLSSITRASVGGKEIPVFKKRKRDINTDE